VLEAYLGGLDDDWDEPAHGPVPADHSDPGEPGRPAGRAAGAVQPGGAS